MEPRTKYNLAAVLMSLGFIPLSLFLEPYLPLGSRIWLWTAILLLSPAAYLVKDTWWPWITRQRVPVTLLDAQERIIARPTRKMFWKLYGVAIFLFLSDLAWSFSATRAEVNLKFVYPESPAVVLMNESDSTVREVKWSLAIWNLDLPERNDPLPIPVATFDWIRKHSESGPQAVFTSPNVSSLLNAGDRLRGSASVSCAECKGGRTFLVSITWGQGGWYSELDGDAEWFRALGAKPGQLVIPKTFSRTNRDKAFEIFEHLSPPESRRAIQDLD